MPEPSSDDVVPKDPPPARGDARYHAFLATVTQLRPSLHRFCARMTGSVLDGEDVVQEALLDAYRKLDTYDDARPMAPWLFRIAHNRCIDHLRQGGSRKVVEGEAAVEAEIEPATEPVGPMPTKAVEHLVLSLPPKERACVLLKDVFDYSLKEIAELVESTVGGVKAALNRGRAKLAELPVESPPPVPRTTQDAALLRLYVERFNRRDWDGVRELISADALLRVADRYLGPLQGAPYFTVYAGLPEPRHFSVAHIDGVAVVLIEHQGQHGWVADAPVRMHIANGKIVAIDDYWCCPWILGAASDVRIDQAS
jgi:RNA polymerase sigma-70 factor (ECF subfamily)